MVRTITTKVYSARHLRRYYPEGFQRALERYRENVREDTYHMDEILDSLKGLFGAAGVKMRAWGIGAYSPSSIQSVFPGPGGDGAKGCTYCAAISRGKRVYKAVNGRAL